MYNSKVADHLLSSYQTYPDNTTSEDKGLLCRIMHNKTVVYTSLGGLTTGQTGPTQDRLPTPTSPHLELLDYTGKADEN